MIRRASMVVALLCCGAALAQEANAPATQFAADSVVYVATRQVVPLLAQPVPGSSAPLSAASGDPLTVLAQQGEFLQVRTATGASGWVRRSNVTAEAPVTGDALQQENARLSEQVRTLDAQVRAFQDENAQLRARMQALDTEFAARTRPVPLTLGGLIGLVQRMATDPRAWICLFASLLALLIAFRLGVAHRNKAIRERLGGLDL